MENVIWSWICSINWTAEAVTAAGTAALAFLTLTLAAGTLFLWLATRRLVKESEETAERQLRAYIFPENVIVDATHGVLRYTITFKNCGQTPAYDVTLYTTMAAAVYPMLEEPKGPATPPTESNGHLGPGLSIHCHTIPDPPVTSDEIKAIRAGKAALYLFGKISYTDAFKKKRFVNFCYFRGGPYNSFGDE